MLLPNGKVLVIGGMGPTGAPITGCELFDPATNQWSSAGTMTTARMGHVAAFLSQSGKILVAGGRTTSGLTSSAEYYDPATNTWSR